MRLLRYTLAIAFGLFLLIPASVHAQRATVDSVRTDLRRYCKTGSAAKYLCPVDTLRLQRVSDQLAPTPVPPPPTPTPTPVDTSHGIALTVVRFDTTAATSVTVANGIPLKQGALMPTALKHVRVSVNGVDQNLYVEALNGRYPDGSLRAVFVAFASATLKGTTLPAVLTLTSPRVTTDLPKPTAYRGVPQAAALPTDANYLVASAVLPTITLAQTKALGGVYAAYDSLFATWADYHWQREGTSWGDNFYDRAAIYYEMWTRTGNPEYWKRATLIADAYRRDYVEYQKYQISTYVIASQGMFLHYLATGEPNAFYAVGRIAQQFAGCVKTSTENPNCYMAPLSYNQDLRNPSRFLEAFLWSWILQSPGDPGMGTQDWAALLSRGTDLMLSTQEADGGYKSQEYCYGIPPYQIGIFNDQLIRQYLLFNADPRIVTSIGKSTDWLWRTQWVDAANGFHYTSVDCPDNGLGTSVGSTAPSPDLTGMVSDSFAWIAAQRKDSASLAIARTVFSSAVNTGYYIGSKQFNQAYMSSMLALPALGPARNAMSIPIRKP